MARTYGGIADLQIIDHCVHFQYWRLRPISNVVPKIIDIIQSPSRIFLLEGFQHSFLDNLSRHIHCHVTRCEDCPIFVAVDFFKDQTEYSRIYNSLTLILNIATTNCTKVIGVKEFENVWQCILDAFNSSSWGFFQNCSVENLQVLAICKSTDLEALFKLCKLKKGAVEVRNFLIFCLNMRFPFLRVVGQNFKEQIR